LAAPIVLAVGVAANTIGAKSPAGLTICSPTVKGGVAHNRYREAIPSGENVIVDTEIAQLTAAGIEVLPFQRASDSIGDLPLAQKALLPVSPIYGRAARPCCPSTTRTRGSRPGWCAPRTRTACRSCRRSTTTARSARRGCTSG